MLPTRPVLGWACAEKLQTYLWRRCSPEWRPTVRLAQTTVSVVAAVSASLPLRRHLDETLPRHAHHVGRRGAAVIVRGVDRFRNHYARSEYGRGCPLKNKSIKTNSYSVSTLIRRWPL